ncbi:TPA: hypothetical protein ACQ49S_000975 [Klebsiella aerogenes]
MNKLNLLVIALTMLPALASARTEQDFYAAKAECMSMAGSINTPQLENNRIAGFNRGFVDGANEMAAIISTNNKTETYYDCLRGKGWNPQGEDINVDDVAGGNNSTAITPVMREIKNIPELNSWYKFDSSKFQVAVDIDNQLRSKKGWQSVSMHNRFERVVDVTNAIYGDTPTSDEDCLAADLIPGSKDPEYQLAALRMFPADVVKNYNLMCARKTDQLAYSHFKEELKAKESQIAGIKSVQNIKTQGTANSVDDY